MALIAARERDVERIERDQARIDDLLSKVDELLSLQKAAMPQKKSVTIINGWSVLYCLK